MNAYDYFNKETGLITKRDRLLELLRKTRRHYGIVSGRFVISGSDRFYILYGRIAELDRLQYRVKNEIDRIDSEFNEYCRYVLCI